MAIAQPLGTDKLNSPDHAALHRIIAADVTAPVESIQVDSSGKVTMPYGVSSSFTIDDSSITYVPIDGDINTYITNLPSTGGVLILGFGSYHITTAINVNKPCTIVGQGLFGTWVVLDAPYITGFNITNPYVELRDVNVIMKHDGNVGVTVDGSANFAAFVGNQVFLRNMNIYFSGTSAPTVGVGDLLVKDANVEVHEGVFEINATSASVGNFYNVKVLSETATSTFYVSLIGNLFDISPANTTGIVACIWNDVVGTPSANAQLTFYRGIAFSMNSNAGGYSYACYANGANTITVLNSGSDVRSISGNTRYDVIATNGAEVILNGVVLGFGKTSGNITYTSGYEYTPGINTLSYNNQTGDNASFFETYDVGAGNYSKSLLLYRKDGTSSENLQLFLDPSNTSYFAGTQNVNILGGLGTDFATKPIALLGGYVQVGPGTPTSNVQLLQYGYVTAMASQEKIIWSINADGYFYLTRVSGYPLGFTINMPFTLIPQSAPLAPIEGMMYYDNSTHHFYGWTGAVWKQLDA